MVQNNRFLLASKLKPADCTPIWLMRQAGRYMEEYRKLREKHPLLTLCKTPELAAQITLQPIHRFNLDAAIIFSDILLPLPHMGLDLEYAKGEGPIIGNPVRTTKDVETLRPIIPQESLSYVCKAIKIATKELDGIVPLIGFAGGPFTLASYMIEGESSRTYLLTKSFMYNNYEAWHKLMDYLSKIVLDYLEAQIRSGAQIVQLFDSWAGILSPSDYKKFVLPYSQFILKGIARWNVPVIHFGTGTSGLLGLFKEAGGDVIGIDWRISITDARSVVGHNVAVQGNLDPAILLGNVSLIRKEVERILSEVIESSHNRSLTGFIFNLGHGVLEETPIENVEALIQIVHQLSSAKLSQFIGSS